MRRQDLLEGIVSMFVRANISSRKQLKVWTARAVEDVLTVFEQNCANLDSGAEYVREIQAQVLHMVALFIPDVQWMTDSDKFRKMVGLINTDGLPNAMQNFPRVCAWMLSQGMSWQLHKGSCWSAHAFHCQLAQ
jgi:hypothetical protein